MAMRNAYGWVVAAAGLGMLVTVARCGMFSSSEFSDPTPSALPDADGLGDAPTISFGDAAIGCVGLECQRVKCDKPGQTTKLAGTVFDPAGKNPLYNVLVYIPNAELAKIDDGATCDRCGGGGTVSGSPLAVALSDAKGNFVLENVPAGKDIPLVVQIGKWRRKVVLPNVVACSDNVIDKAATRLPRNRGEGHIPKMALTTGAADPLECLLRKIGLDDSEFAPSGDARIHLYKGYGYGSNQASGDLADGGAFTAANQLWNDVTKLKAYDVVLLACEGNRNTSTKPTTANIYDYALAGGRVFATHWHDYWFVAGPTAVQEVGAWNARTDPPSPVEATINTGFPKGQALYDWLGNVDALTENGKLVINDGRHNLDSADSTKSTTWITIPNANVSMSPTVPEYVTFNAPVGADETKICGKVVFSDLHVSSGDTTGQSFPNGCTTTDLSPQEKALEFMLFDLSACVQKDDAKPTLPPQ